MLLKFTRLTLLSLWTTLLLPAGQSMAAEVQASAAVLSETRTMPMQAREGAECKVTGVRVESVQAVPEGAAQQVVVSIPKTRVAERPNLRLYKVDTSAFAFDDYQELNSDDAERRRFSFVVGQREQFRFRLGFDSTQE